MFEELVRIGHISPMSIPKKLQILTNSD